MNPKLHYMLFNVFISFVTFIQSFSAEYLAGQYRDQCSNTYMWPFTRKNRLQLYDIKSLPSMIFVMWLIDTEPLSVTPSAMTQEC